MFTSDMHARTSDQKSAEVTYLLTCTLHTRHKTFGGHRPGQHTHSAGLQRKNNAAFPAAPAAARTLSPPPLTTHKLPRQARPGPMQAPSEEYVAAASTPPLSLLDHQPPQNVERQQRRGSSRPSDSPFLKTQRDPAIRHQPPRNVRHSQSQTTRSRARRSVPSSPLHPPAEHWPDTQNRRLTQRSHSLPDSHCTLARLASRKT